MIFFQRPTYDGKVFQRKIMQEFEKDNGDWLSAQQAVRPDGTEVTNLPLINKKLPPLVKPAEADLPRTAAANVASEPL